MISRIKYELEKILGLSDITRKRLQHNILGPRFIKSYRKLGSENARTDGYLILLMGYIRPPFGDFESHLRFLVGLDANDIQLILKQ